MLKKGDKVRVKTKEELDKSPDKGHGFIDEMKEYCGKSGIIEKTNLDDCEGCFEIYFDHKNCSLDDDDFNHEGWGWNEWMVTKMEEK